MAPTKPKVRSQAEWAEILDRIQADVAQSLAQTPETVPHLPPSDPTAVVHSSLAQLDNRIVEMQKSLERADRCAADSDAILHAEAENMRLWCESIKRVREKLANWATQS